MKRSSMIPFLLLAACGTEDGATSSSLTRAVGECSDVEVHVIGVSDGGGASTVILARPGKHRLVLTAYEATTWNIEVKPGAELEQVYAVGNGVQKVNTNVQTSILTESAAEGGPGATGYEYPNTQTVSMMKLAALRVGLHPTSFHGCYAASHWEIGENMAVSSDCGAGTYTQYNAVIDCDGDNTCGEDGEPGTGTGGTGSGGGTGGGDGSLY
jgi:hypothetical protein